MYHSIFQDDFQIGVDFQGAAMVEFWSKSSQWQKSQFLHDILNGGSEILELPILWLKGPVQIQHPCALQRHDPKKEVMKNVYFKNKYPCL